MSYAAMPVPAVRLRALQPLVEDDGSCALIYDLERAAVVEVPMELQFYIALALERGEPDEALVGWLVSEDLLTSENQEGWSDRSGLESLVELIDPGWKGASLRLQDELQVRIEDVDLEAMRRALDLTFVRSHDAGRLCLFFDWCRRFPGAVALESAVVEAKRRSEERGREVSFEVSLAIEEVTPFVARTLANLPVGVRLLYDAAGPSISAGAAATDTATAAEAPPSCDSSWRQELVLGDLIERLGERLTVRVPVRGPELLATWEWAKRMRVGRLDVLPAGDGTWSAGQEPLRELRRQLLAICGDMVNELSAHRLPVDFLPLTRLVSRLRRSEPRGGEPLEVFEPSVWLYRRAVADGLDAVAMEGTDGAWGGWEEGDLDAGSGAARVPCHTCWARWVCGHSAFVAAALPERDALRPSKELCARWRSEVEVALRFYHQLAQTDPVQALRFFEGLPHEEGERLELPRAPF